MPRNSLQPFFRRLQQLALEKVHLSVWASAPAAQEMLSGKCECALGTIYVVKLLPLYTNPNDAEITERKFAKEHY